MRTPLVAPPITQNKKRTFHVGFHLLRSLFRLEQGASSMARRAARDLTVEDYDAWCEATKGYETVAKAADEEGGPSLSLVPRPERELAWPTDLLPPAEPDPA